MADEHSPEMRSFVIANIRKTRLRDRTPDQQLAVEFADARDRDVAELVAALDECVQSLAGYRREMNCKQACDAEHAARVLLAKHKGGA